MDQGLVEAAQRGDRDAFTELMRAIGDRLYALAYRILRDPQLAQDAFHACYAESRRRSRWTANVRVLDLESELSVEHVPVIHDRDELERGFQQLSVDHRAIFVLHHYVGLPLIEIGELLGIPSGTARSRLHYATQALRHAMDADTARAAAKERLA